jgi:CheY-like chemotaxis protein
MPLILVVEDDDFLRPLIEEILQTKGYHVVTTETAKQALRLCQERTFGLVITDLSMPDMDGLTLIRALRRSHSSLPVLATSGAFNDALKIAVKLGAVGGLQKPFSPDDLLAAVDKILGKQSG